MRPSGMRAHRYGARAAAATVLALVAACGTSGPNADTVGSPSRPGASTAPTAGDSTDGGGAATEHGPWQLVGADIRLATARHLDSSTTRIPLLVTEPSCASGQPATGRIMPRIRYSRHVLHVWIYVIPYESARCPGNPETPYTLELLEPLWTRKVVLHQHPAALDPQGLALSAETTVADVLEADRPDTWSWHVRDGVVSIWETGRSTKCHRSASYLAVLWPNDPFAVYEQPRGEASSTLPSGAWDTRYRSGPVQLWLAADARAAYLVVGADVQRWPAARPCVAKAVHFRGR